MLTGGMICTFSTATDGLNHQVPELGCKLSQMIVVTGDMKIVGEGDILRELQAVGGAPSTTTRHFLMDRNVHLELKYVKLTLGIVTGEPGGCIKVKDHANGVPGTRLTLLSSHFLSCIANGDRGGAIYAKAMNGEFFLICNFYFLDGH